MNGYIELLIVAGSYALALFACFLIHSTEGKGHRKKCKKNR